MDLAEDTDQYHMEGLGKAGNEPPSSLKANQIVEHQLHLRVSILSLLQQYQGVYCLAALEFQYISSIIFDIFPVLNTLQSKCSNTQMYRYVVTSLTFLLV